MADISSIVQEQSYAGRSELGGGSSGVISIDTAPVLELARYAMFRNKAEFDQRQKDNDAKIADLAQLTALDLNTTRGKDRDLILKQYKEANDFFSEYAKKGKRTPEDILDYNKKLQELKSNINSGTERAIKYQTRLNAINNDVNETGRRKDERIAKLNEEFDKTDIATPIALEDQYSTIVPEIPKGVKMEFDIMENQPNGKVIISNDIFDAAKAGVIAYSFLNNLDVEPLPANASEREIKDYNQRQEAFKKNGAALYPQGADFLTQAINDQKYKDANGNVDYKAIAATNHLAAGNLALIDGWNEYARTMTDKIDKGVFTDKSGRPVSNMLNKNNYLQIDKTKPISAEQLVKAQMWAKFENDKVTKKYVETDDAIQQQNADTARMNALMDDATKRYVANLPYEKQKAGAVGADGQPLDFGNILYGVNTKPNESTTIYKATGGTIPDIKINNGVVVDGKGNIVPYTGDVKLPASYFDASIITEFKKYATIGSGDNAKELAKLYQDSNNNFIVRMQNGEIQGIQTADNEKPGAFASANQFQHITLTAAQQGTTKYKKPDTQLGQTNDKQSQQKVVELSGKIDPSSLKVNQIYSVSGKSYIWDGKKLKAQ